MSDAPTVLLSRIGVSSSGEHGTVTVEVPKSIGPVRLIKQIGAGAMGVVWLGHHEVLARDVAVKFLLSGVGPGSGTEASETFNAFLQGARAAAALRHAGMTAVHDAGAAGGVSYIVMEYVDGPTLGDVMRRGAVPLAVVRTVLAELCEVVAELHEHDLVHRDIKPSNVMVSPDGAAVLTDFGLACPMPAPDSWQAKTAGTTPIAGTPAYMAPEMFAGDVSARSDVYAVGATAFELLTGRCAYQGGLEEVKAAAKAGVVPRGLLEERGVPEGVIDAVERAMNKDAMFRPKTARRLAELFDKGFEAAGVVAATAEEVQQVAFPEGVRAAPAPEPAKGASAGATMFDVVGRRAEEKRRSAPKVEAPEEPQPVVAPISGAAQPASGPVGVVAPGKVAMRAQSVARGGPAAPKLARRMRIYDAAPVPWRALSLAGVVGGVFVAIMAAVMQWVLVGPKLVAIEVGSILGILEASPVPVVVEGRTFGGNTPDLLYAFVQAVFYVIPFLLGVVPVLVLYHWLAFTKGGAWGRCEPVCGWCGHSLLGLHDGKCPECGRRTEDHGKLGDRPPARRWGARVVRYAAGAVVFAVGAGAFAGLLGILSAVIGVKANSAVFDAITAACAFAPAMLAYHFVARRKAVLTGVARCGRCGAPSLDIEHGQCAKCEERERKRSVRAATPVSKVAKGVPIPWRILLGCTAVGTVVLVATVVLLENVMPSEQVLAGQVTEYLHAWDEYAGPGSYVVEGHEFSGSPNALILIVADLITNAGPSVVEGLLIFVVYHRLAFSRAARGRGWTCGWCGYELGAAAAPCCPECGRAHTDRGGRGDRPPARRWGPRLWASAWSAGALVLTLAATVRTARFVMSHWVSADISNAAHAVLGGVIIALPMCLVGLIVYHVTARRTAVLDGAARCGKCGLPGDPVAGCGRCGGATA